MGLLGVIVGLGLLVWLAFRGWSVLLYAPAAVGVAAPWLGKMRSRNWVPMPKIS